MNQTLTYNIHQINVSNPKWVLSHIQQDLKNKKYVTRMNGEWLFFRTSIFYLGPTHISGNICSYIENELLYIRIRYYHYNIIIFFIGLIVFFGSWLLQIMNFIYDLRFVIVISIFTCMVSFFHALARYSKIRGILKDIERLMYVLCK
jgi:hypothetical protein